MNTEVPPPQQARGMGCFGKGCLSFVALVLFLAIAFVAGGIWAVHHLRDTYSSTEPQELPDEVATSGSASAQTDATPGVTAVVPSTVAPTIAPTVDATPLPRTATSWKEFQKAGHRHEKARIELTASDINGLLQESSNTRGKASVSIEGDVGHVHVSIPLDKIYMMQGRYLNGEATVRSSPDGDPAKAQISEIKFGNESVPNDFIDRRVFGWSSVRDYVTKWLNDQDIVVFRIENGRVVGETRG